MNKLEYLELINKAASFDRINRLLYLIANDNTLSLEEAELLSAKLMKQSRYIAVNSYNYHYLALSDFN